MRTSGVGNLIDRFLFDGRVTDFLNVGIGSLRTGIFNIADVVGMLDCILLLVASAGQLHRQLRGPAARSPVGS